MSTTQKIWTDAFSLREHCNALGKKKKIGYIRGCFDLMHDGHRYFVKEARKKCAFLIVSVAPDDYIRATKGPDRPVNNRDIRAHNLADLDDVDAVILSPPENDPNKIEFKVINADIAFFGGDYSQESLPEVYKQFAPKLHFITKEIGPRTTDLVKDKKAAKKAKPKPKAPAKKKPAKKKK